LNEPAKRAKLRAANTVDFSQLGRRHTQKVTLSHLGSTPFNDGQTGSTGKLVNHLRLADAMATAKQHRLTHSRNVGYNTLEGFEVNSHLFTLSFLGWASLPGWFFLTNYIS
jgi:hypothetical protein